MRWFASCPKPIRRAPIFHAADASHNAPDKSDKVLPDSTSDVQDALGAIVSARFLILGDYQSHPYNATAFDPCACDIRPPPVHRHARGAMNATATKVHIRLHSGDGDRELSHAKRDPYRQRDSHQRRGCRSTMRVARRLRQDRLPVFARFISPCGARQPGEQIQSLQSLRRSATLAAWHL